MQGFTPGPGIKPSGILTESLGPFQEILLLSTLRPWQRADIWGIWRRMCIQWSFKTERVYKKLEIVSRWYVKLWSRGRLYQIEKPLVNEGMHAGSWEVAGTRESPGVCELSENSDGLYLRLQRTGSFN